MRSNILIAMATLLVLGVLLPPASSVAQPNRHKVLIVGVDMSRPSPAFDLPTSIMAANYVSQRVDGLNYRDRVVLKSFGAYGFRANPLHKEWELSKRNRPPAVAEELSSIF